MKSAAVICLHIKHALIILFPNVKTVSPSASVFSLGGGLGSTFGSRTPFRSQSFNVGSHSAGGGGLGSRSGAAAKEKLQDPAVEHDLLVSLEDIQKGVTKRMKISR